MPNPKKSLQDVLTIAVIGIVGIVVLYGCMPVEAPRIVTEIATDDNGIAVDVPTQTPYVVIVTATPELQNVVPTLQNTVDTDPAIALNIDGQECTLSTERYFQYAAWSGEWLFMLPDYGVARSDSVLATVELVCGQGDGGLTSSFIVPTLPKESNAFTLSFTLAEGGLKTDACFLSRQYSTDAGEWSNTWPCYLFLKNVRQSIFCGAYQREKEFTISGVLPSELDEDSSPCR